MKEYHFKIKKDHHYSNCDVFKPIINTGRIDKKIMALFSNDCIYNETELPSPGINKLLGFTRIHHQEKIPVFKNFCNSWLIGWKCSLFNKEYKLLFYSYYDYRGEEFRIPINTNHGYNFNKPMNITVFERQDHMSWEISQGMYHDSFTQPIGLATPKIGYHLWPYFGGKSRAPHDMYINLSL
jgi:hypothetical protein